MAPERRACTLYLRKAVWTRRAASYSSLCSGSDRVSWARSRSTLLLEALMNSLQSAGDGNVDLSRGPSLNGDPPGLRLGLDDGVRGSLYRDLRTKYDRKFQFISDPLLLTTTVCLVLDCSRWWMCKLYTCLTNTNTYDQLRHLTYTYCLN